MAEEPDGGRDVHGERAPRVDWSGLEPAVRRVEDAPADRTDRTDWGDLTPAVRSIEPGGRLGDWSDLTPAIRPQSSGDGWTAEDFHTPETREGPSTASDPQLLADEEHQADEPGDSATETVIEPDETPTSDDDLVASAPESDAEQPLAVHIEEMIKRLAIVIAVAGLASVVVFPLTEGLITTIWNYVLPGGEAVDPRVYHPLELIITQVKVASLAGLVVALPVFVYESYAFMRPGLYKHERRYYLAAVPSSLVLAVLGVLFGYLLVLPYTMDYFQGYTEGTADVAFALGTTFNLILMVMGYLAVVFQIPLFIMLAIMLGVVTRRWLESRRLLFWAAFAGISFTFGAIDPTGVVPIIVAITMIALFEGTLALLRWTGN
ncbi:twin-arginine translocase subunit TatC [Halobacterium wangiae]|uniref:twin-arginine translocase subunit TatC n=1 Tax=Halobacterium wangiae TaxID=2902623 RepID=UPI0022B7BD27|nr:twin-arginine translocase subunit TatC [Halobacterium wangiae]